MLGNLRNKYLGTESSSWASNFNLISSILGSIGFSLQNNSTKSISSKFRFYISLFVFCLLCICTLYSALTESEIDLRFNSTVFLLTQIEAFLKVVYFWIWRADLQKMVEMVSTRTAALDDEPLFCKEVGAKYRGLSNKIVLIACISYSICFFIFIICPLLIFGDWVLPIHSPVIGISHRNHPGYEINYFCISLHLLYCSITIFPFDVIFFLFCFYVVSRFEVCQRFSNLIGDEASPYNTEEKQKQLLKYLVDVHTDAVQFLGDIQNVGKFPILATFLCSAGILCFSLIRFQTVSRYTISVALNFFSTAFVPVLVGLGQIFLYSISAEIIFSKNKEFLTAVYCSHWYELKDIGTKKEILLILTNAQTLNEFNVGGFFVLSMETFSEVVQACYSFVAFLVNLI